MTYVIDQPNLHLPCSGCKELAAINKFPRYRGNVCVVTDGVIKSYRFPVPPNEAMKFVIYDLRGDVLSPFYRSYKTLETGHHSTNTIDFEIQ